VKILEGDCVEVMRGMDDESIDAIVTDPPYGLGFMGKAWDDLPPGLEWARECLRVLKPGGHLLAFGGSRTYHRLAVAVEDAGFEVRDQMMWLYGSGFPKSLDVSKAIDKQRDDRAEILQVTQWIREARDKEQVSNGDIDKAFGFAGMSGHWTSSKSQPAVPTLDQVPLLLQTLKVDPANVPYEIARLLLELNGRKGQPGENWLQREVIRTRDVPLGPGFAGETYRGEDTGNVKYNDTAPATADAKKWSGWGTALKPAHEPIVVARKPLVGTVAENVLRFGTGALNIDGCRIGSDGGTAKGSFPKGESNGIYGDGINGACEIKDIGAGRWPANLMLDEEAGRLLDEQSGTLTSGANPTRRGADDSRQVLGAFGGQDSCDASRGTDAGGASRFFYCAKAGKAERNAGLDAFEINRPDNRTVTGMGTFEEKGVQPQRNHHPTVKPISLMAYLVRLVTPPNGTILDPFLGSGTTGCAAALEGFDFIGIEREPDYIAIAEARIAWWEKHKGDAQVSDILAAGKGRDEVKDAGQLDLLGDTA
jgi:DNA modification methylase